jgi:hypothetical protein
VKTHGISMFFLTKGVFAKYWLLIVKMYAENSRSNAILKNLNFLCDVEFIIGILCIFSMLECVHALIKIAKSKDVFMCDFVEFVKLAQHELYWFYCDLYAKYENLAFDEFNSIQTLTNIPFL